MGNGNDENFECTGTTTLTITGYKGPGGNIIIPSDINGIPITAIGSKAFMDKKLTGVTIPKSITSIEDDAFKRNQLDSVDIPNSIKYIRNGVFAENKLTSVKIPKKVDSIGTDAFKDNQLTNVTFNNVKDIGDRAFMNNRLASVKIYGAKTISCGAFAQNQLTNVNIPNVISIGGGAFAQNQLTSITIPRKLKFIGGGAFMINKLINVQIPCNVAKIEYAPFSNCPELREIKIPINNPKYFSEGGVLYNKARTVLIQWPAKKTQVKIPAGVTSIERNAFIGCGLPSIIIPANVTKIGNSAFALNQLTSVTFEGYISSGGFVIGAFGNDDSNIGDLRDKYLAGGKGTYTRPSDSSKMWTRQ